MNRTHRLLLVLLVVSALLAGCHRRRHHHWSAGDSSADVVAPSQTNNLSVTGTTDSTVTLTWTAPGDDGTAGQAAAYDLRYAFTPINTEADFTAATQVSGEPAPAPSSWPELMAVAGLLPGTSYWFALKTLDEAGNASGISNSPRGTTLPAPDVTPPAAVTDLTVLGTTSVSASLQWTAPGDDGMSGTSSSYDLRYATAPIVSEADFAAATPAAGEPVPAPAGETDALVINGLTPGTTYWFALKTSDEVPNASALSNVPTAATAGTDVIAPGAILDLAVTAATYDTLTLGWTAPGDDGASGTAASYDVRMSLAPITTDAEFDAATPAGPVLVPSPAGTPEVMVVNGVLPATQYWFAIKASDEVPNTGALSNSPSGTTLPPPDVTPPAAIADLAVVAWTDQSLTVSWTAPGDDGAAGIAAFYDLRISTSPILTLADFAAASQVPGVPAPQPAGSMQVFVVDGLAPGVTRHFAIRTGDEVPNLGALSNPASGTTSAQPVQLTIEETEPNSTIDTATPLPIGTPGHGRLDTFDDVDFWSFGASAGDIIRVDLFSTRMTQQGWNTSDAIPILKILDAAGTELLRHDRAAWLDGDHDLDVPLFRIPAAGTYFLRLQASNGNAEREYAVLVQDVPMTVTFEAEAAGASGANDTLATAEFVAGPATVYGWHVDGESDYFAFTASAGDILRLGITAYRNGIVQGPGYFNPRLWLYGPDGKKVEKVSSTVFHDVELAYYADVPGTYTVRVIEDGGSAGEGPYFLAINAAPAQGGFDVEPNDTPATANPVGYGTFVAGTTGSKDDDVFAFDAAAGDMIRVEVYDKVNSDAAKHDVGIELLASDGITVLPGEAPAGAFNTFRSILTASGTHYLRFTGKGNGSFYAFRLVLFKDAAWETEPNDDPASPGALDAAGRAAGSVASAGDADAFGFTATATQLITLSVYAGRAAVPPGSDGDDQRSGWGSTLSPRVTVRDAGGNVLAVSENGLANVSAESVTNPLPTLEVSFIAPVSGAYTVTVEDATGAGSATKTYVIQRR
ncbi:MAG: hypothetical protein FD180_2236 [Planctomycetota bacterium]|nr:MAG: hypothetical protein FD180_2236 [Planctomycetota bacterium]